MADHQLCDGEVCVDCCLCSKCGRKVGTPHIDVCACPPDALHWRCSDCAAKYVASVLAPYDRYALTEKDEEDADAV